GWVTLFAPDELAALVHLPAGVEPLGWLCVGYPDERPPEPGLVRAGWSTRLPLDEVIVHERWPAGTGTGTGPTAAAAAGPAPAPPPSKLRAPAPDAVVAARDEA